ncbi:MAG: hypothetical protein MI799_23600 [Desulfobacterales bacterium]|nr:hypothetical protein [Desulfobacterales bacterium]
MQTPRSVYIAFEVFPRPKGASSHMASMLRALESGHGPVLSRFGAQVDMFMKLCTMLNPAG